MMKRILSLVLSLMLLCSIVPAVAEYDTHVSFTINAGHTNSEMDYTSDDLYKMISGKFNFERRPERKNHHLGQRRHDA